MFEIWLLVATVIGLSVLLITAGTVKLLVTGRYEAAGGASVALVVGVLFLVLAAVGGEEAAHRQAKVDAGIFQVTLNDNFERDVDNEVLVIDGIVVTGTGME